MGVFFYDWMNHVNATEAHGATGAVVGTTNSQTLTNKILSNANIYGGAITDDVSVFSTKTIDGVDIGENVVMWIGSASSQSKILNGQFVGGNATLSSGSKTITISNPFNSAADYIASASRTSTAGASESFTINYVSGSSFIILSSDPTSSSTVRWLAFGQEA